MSDVIIYQGAAIPFSFSRQNGQPLDVTSVMRTLADITTYAANAEKKYVPYEGQTITCLEDKMLYILELKNGVLIPKLSGGVKLIKKDDNVELTDDAALSALRSVKEIEDRAISRTKRDTAAEVIEFVKGLTAANGKTTVSGDGKITTLNLLVQALAETYDLNVSHVATMMRTIIKDYVSSEAFTPGLTGEGFKISKALNGDWNLEIDNIVVRKVMTIFEMVISKVRSVNGGLVISPANGRIKSVAETTGSPAYYVIGIEGDMQFVVDDYVRCQVFSNGHAKYYWVRVSSISGNSILVLKSEFTNGAVPAVGDDLVQMGNATNKARQGLIYLTASEDGKPRISVMDGVNSTSTVGKSKVILGCLDGITDTDFPADFQPSGYGLYAMNVFLKGIFVLRSGKTVESELTTTNAAVTAAKQIADAAKELANSANALLSDIASDNKLTPSEKQATKKEWEQIVSEKVKNDASADKYGVSKVACTTAYNALSAYITPLLASLTTTSDIVGATFRSTFKAYYDARADLLNSISAKAKDLADAAQGKATEAANAAATAQAKANQANTAAGAAQSTADGAVANAATANSLLSDIANDNKFTATEKQQTKKEWDVIVSEKPLNNASAVKFYVSTAAYDTAYNALNAYITPLLASLSTTSNIVGATFRSTFKAYYDARTNLLNAVSEKAKRLADDAQNAANAAQAKADTVTASLQTFLAGGGLFESKITEVKEYADGKVNALQVGSRNLLLKSSIEIGALAYNVGNYAYSLYDRKKNIEYTLTICYTLSDNVEYIGAWEVGGSNFFGALKKRGSRVVESITFIPKNTNWGDANQAMGIYQLPMGQYGAKVHWAVMTEGNKGLSAFTPAPEDVAADTEAARLAAVAAQNKANEAATNAATAQTAANNAASTANAAKSRLDNWSADGSISPTEKLTLKQEQKALLDEKTQIVADAAKYAVSSTAYVTAYTNYNGELTYHTATTPEVIAIRANFATYQAAYYTAKQTILNAISVAAKKYAEDKANDAKQAAINDAVGKYPTKTEFSTSITQLSNSISLKASQTEVTGLGTRVTAAEAKITPDAIRLTVKSQTDTIAQDAAKNAVDGLQMGGRNLALNSELTRTGTYNLETYRLSEELIAGEMYCATFFGTLGANKSFFQLWMGGGYTTIGNYTMISNGIYMLQFKAPVLVGGNGRRNEVTVYAAPPSITTTSTVTKFKLEKGNKPTDWTPAPEDVQSQITDNKAQIQVLSDQIKSTVSKETFNALGDRVGLAETTILQQAGQITAQVTKVNDLTGRVDKAELALHPDKIWLGLTAKVDGAIESKVKTGISITPGIINVFGKQISLAGAVTFSSMASDAQGKINDAQNAANAAGAAAGAAKNTADKAITDAANAKLSATSANAAITNLTNSLGGLAYSDLVGLAKLDTTIIEGGYIKTNLINATAIVTSVLAATNVTATNLTVTGNSKIGGMVIKDGKLTGGSIVLTEGAKIGDLYIVGGAFSSLNTNIIPPGTSWFSMSKDSLSYSSYSYYDYSMHSCRITGGGVNIDNGSIVVKNANGTALDVQGSIITRPGSGEERTGKNLDFMISGVWVGSNKYDIILQVTNGLITSYRLQ